MNNFLLSHFNKLKFCSNNPELDLRILLNKSKIIKEEIILSNFKIENINQKEFNKNFIRRINFEPISKIFNSKSFWKYDFFVNKEVLDPRPETELILENILKLYANKKKELKILDMCTGSGCIAISLAKEYPKSKITATDISKKALKVATKNAKKLNCLKQIKFIECNLLNNIECYDIVVSNPPYISETDYIKSSQEIQLYEPRIALVASNNGYEFYEKISNILPNILSNTSRAFIEIGSTQAKKTINIFKLKQINCLDVVKDIQNLNRLLILNKS